MTAPPYVYALPSLSDLWPFGKKGVAYDIAITDIKDKELREELHKRAEEAVNEENLPKNEKDIQALSGVMANRVAVALKARAFYDAEAMSAVEAKEGGKGYLIRITPAPGERYTVEDSIALWRGPYEKQPVPGFAAHVVPAGEPAAAEKILAASALIAKEIQDGACLLSLDVKPAVIPDRAAKTVTVRYTIETGGEATFGPLTIKGDTRVKEEAILRFVKWKEGECYNRSDLEATENALIKSRLFSVARIDVPEQADENGAAPVTLTVKDRKHRTVTAGGRYATDTGVGVNAGWEHRNMRGLGHKLKTEAAVSELGYDANASYEVPFFRSDNQKLTVSGAVAREETDAYDSSNITGLASVTRQMTPALSAGAGGGFRLSEVTQDGDTEEFGLVYIPLFAEYDTRDNVLNASKGRFARVSAAPYFDVSGSGTGFIVVNGVAQTYFTDDNLPLKPTLALRTAAGIISGASLGDVPADIRYYSGGGGSVRGYAYQAIGPKDASGNPTGALNMAEAGAELRLRFTETIGGALFFEGGGLSQDGIPFEGTDFFWGAGGGLRYYSPVGPVRFDVGVPLRDIKGESAYQIYVSLGQAF